MKRVERTVTIPSTALDPEGASLARLAEGVFRRYGYDPRHFSAAHPRRRLDAAMRWEVVSVLRTYPFTWVWPASRGNGLEAWGLAVLMAVFSPALRKNIVFAQHNLATYGSFNEFNRILCRNVLSTLDEGVRKRAHGLLYQRLTAFGYMALGDRDAPDASLFERRQEVVMKSRVYRKVR